MAGSVERVRIILNYEGKAWKWMRYSGLLLIPLAWGQVLIQDVLVGVHQIDIDYLAMHWASLGWRVYDFLLLAFAFAHGVNGLRQVVNDFIKNKRLMPRFSVLLFVLCMGFYDRIYFKIHSANC